nr:Chain B, ARG-GLU-ARG-ALA-ARG-THR-ARG [Peptide display vector fth1]
RERARTR